MIALRVTGGGAGRTVYVPPAPARLVVGSSPAADLCLPDPGLDPEHLVVEETPGGVRITDQGTRNGTKLNGLFVNQAVVQAGDEIRLGGVMIAVVAEAMADAPPPAAAVKPEPARARPERKVRPRKRAVAPPPAAPSAPVGPKLSRSPTRPGARPRSRTKKVWIAVVALVAAGVLAALFFAGSGESARQAAARALYSSAQAAWDRGERDEAEKLFTEVVTDYADSPEAPRAQAAVEKLAKLRQREVDAYRARSELREQWTQLTPDQFRIAWREFKREWENTPAVEDERFLAEVERDYQVEGERRIAEARKQANALLREDRYHDAVLVWHSYIYVPQNIEPDVEEAQKDFARIQKLARTEYEELAAEADRMLAQGKPEEGIELLRGKLDHFRGTRHAFDIRQKMEVMAIRGGGEEIAPEVVEERVEKRQKYLRVAEDAESLANRRRYREAVESYRRAAAACPHGDLVAEFTARADELEDLAVLFDALGAQIGSRPEAFRGIDLGHGLKANVVSADKDKIVVSIREATSELSWSRMGPDRILPLMLRLSLAPRDRLRLALYAFEAGDEEAGFAQVTAALKADDSLTDVAFGVLARARGIPVPDEGFVAFKGRWMTPVERQEAELREEIAAAERDARSSDGRRSAAGLDKLRELGAPAQAALVRALTSNLEQTIESMKGHPMVKDPGTKQLLFRELEDRRKAALALIFDTVKYPYPHPDGPAYDSVQAEVDTLVGAVRVIWTRPVAYLIDKVPEVRELYSRGESCALELTQLGHPPERTLADLIAEVNGSIDMPRFTPDSKSRNDLEWSDKVLAFNRTVVIDADQPERDCVDALNEYRMMMGMRAVMWNDKLLACARGHSAHMRDHGYFAHDVPLPGAEFDPIRSPGQRARLAGYSGGVSENIARGSTDGRATFRQWYGSSGHHRNMLGKNHTEVGVGRADDFWTQNFGRAKSKVD